MNTYWVMYFQTVCHVKQVVSKLCFDTPGLGIGQVWNQTTTIHI